MKITYKFATGEATTIEVTDEIGEILIDLDRKEYNVNHKETRRHTSLDGLNFEESCLPITLTFHTCWSKRKPPKWCVPPWNSSSPSSAT